METTGFNLNDGLYFEKYEFEKWPVTRAVKYI